MLDPLSDAEECRECKANVKELGYCSCGKEVDVRRDDFVALGVVPECFTMFVLSRVCWVTFRFGVEALAHTINCSWVRSGIVVDSIHGAMENDSRNTNPYK